MGYVQAVCLPAAYDAQQQDEKPATYHNKQKIADSSTVGQLCLRPAVHCLNTIT